MATRSIGTGAGGDGQSQLTVQLQIANGSAGSQTFTFDILANANSQYDFRTVNLASGDNTITVPTTAAGVVLLAPATNAVAWKVKGNAGDTAIAQGLTGIHIETFPTSPPASILLNAGATLNGMKVFFF